LTAPRTEVAAEAIVDGFFAGVFRRERDAAARAAVFRCAVFVFRAGRFAAARDCGDVLRVCDFAVRPDVRFATPPPWA
jgi:hypothetical protein